MGVLERFFSLSMNVSRIICSVKENHHDIDTTYINNRYNSFGFALLLQNYHNVWNYCRIKNKLLFMLTFNWTVFFYCLIGNKFIFTQFSALFLVLSWYLPFYNLQHMSFGSYWNPPSFMWSKLLQWWLVIYH